MKINKAGIVLIKKWEGFKSKPYLCPAKVPTIGYGTTRYPNGKRVALTDPEISEARAELFLVNDVRRFSDAVTKALTVVINENRYSALVSLCYNIGPGALGRSTLIKVINAAPGTPGIREEFMKWTKATVNGKKVELKGLVNRRKEEADLYFKID